RARRPGRQRPPHGGAVPRVQGPPRSRLHRLPEPAAGGASGTRAAPAAARPARGAPGHAAPGRDRIRPLSGEGGGDAPRRGRGRYGARDRGGRRPRDPVARAAANGVGRNFFIEQYLREGDYQITVATQGSSKGHLGLTLERTQLVDGGALSEGGPARRALAPGEAVAYHFTIAEAGDYRVRSFGAGTTFRCRLENDAGWPVEPPNVTADLTRHFEPGTYRIVSLPEPVATRRVTLFERVRQAAKGEGHGPHALALAERAEHVWTDPEAGRARVPDTWLLTVPAPIDARIELTGEMQGDLVRTDGEGAAVSVPPGRGWKGKL